jgi:hypothetical protein
MQNFRFAILPFDILLLNMPEIATAVPSFHSGRLAMTVNAHIILAWKAPDKI